MTIQPEDVRKHLATGRSGEEAKPGAVPAGRAGAGEPPPPDGPPTVAPGSPKEEAILVSISASYFGLRRGLAVIALAMPILLWLRGGYDHLQGSISAYYHYFYSPTGAQLYGGGAARDILVGILCAAGAALYFYKGYSWKENWALNIAGVAAILLAVAPMDWPSTEFADKSVLSWIHSVAAVVFFLAIAFVCLFCSGETLALMKEDDARRLRFQRTYMVIGTLMIVLPLSVVAINFLMPSAGESYVTFAIEVVAIYVFAAFWLVKSKEITLIQAA